MRNDSVAAGFTSSLIFHKDGSVTARYGYDRAVRLLYEYERSGVAPEDAETGRRRTSWERYTMKTPNGDIAPGAAGSVCWAACSAMSGQN